MTLFEITGWNNAAAWADYSGQGRHHLDVRLKAARHMGLYTHRYGASIYRPGGTRAVATIKDSQR